MQRTNNAMMLSGDLFPGLPLLEIYGNRRVLIENHCGVSGYSCCEIIVQTKQGIYSILGEHLEISSMTKHQLIITGIIESVMLKYRR